MDHPEGTDMKQTARVFSIIFMLGSYGVMGCQRETPTEKVEKVTDTAAEVIERAINTPIEKAKAVEGTLQRAADRTAEQTQNSSE
jgi:hypothetical protein